jgi:hypothetical protein
MRVYVAGPLTADTADGCLANVRAAIDAGVRLIRRGHEPYVPHLSWYLDQHARAAGHPIPYDWWLEYDRHYLAGCDALLLLAPSPGANAEAAWARARGIPVYEHADALPPPVRP